MLVTWGWSIELGSVAGHVTSGGTLSIWSAGHVFTLSVSRGCVLVKAGNTLILRGGSARGLFPATYYQIFVSISIKFIFILGWVELVHVLIIWSGRNCCFVSNTMPLFNQSLILQTAEHR